MAYVVVMERAARHHELRRLRPEAAAHAVAAVDVLDHVAAPVHHSNVAGFVVCAQQSSVETCEEPPQESCLLTLPSESGAHRLPEGSAQVAARVLAAGPDPQVADEAERGGVEVDRG